MQLQPPDQLSVVLLWIAAIFMALRAGVEQWPAARTAFPAMSAGWLGFIPLVLLLIAAMLTIVRGGREIAPEPKETKEVSSPFDFNGREAVPLPPVPSGDATILPESVSRQFRDLMLDGPTDVQQQKFLRPFLGKKMRLAAILRMVEARDDGFLALFSFSESGAPDLIVYFDKDWEDYLAQFKPGNTVVFQAEIAQVATDRIRLMHGEIIQ